MFYVKEALITLQPAGFGEMDVHRGLNSPGFLKGEIENGPHPETTLCSSVDPVGNTRASGVQEFANPTISL